MKGVRDGLQHLILDKAYAAGSEWPCLLFAVWLLIAK